MRWLSWLTKTIARRPQRAVLLGVCVSVVVMAAGAGKLVGALRPQASQESQVLALLLEAGRALQRDIAREVAPAIARTRLAAAAPDVTAAICGGDVDALTAALNRVIQASTEIDALAAFDRAGDIRAINTVYSSGKPVDPWRVGRVLGVNFDRREIIQHCLRNEAADEVVEFQTHCDITPAFFDSSGLSVAITVPVSPAEGQPRCGLLSARLAFERLSSLSVGRSIGGRPDSVQFVTDDGRYFSESINSGRQPAPVPQEELAQLVAPLHDDELTAGSEVVARWRDQFVALFPVRGFRTLAGGGIQVMLLAPADFVDSPMTHARLMGAACVVIGVLLLMLTVCTWAFLASVESGRQTEHARQEAEAASKAKSEFLANMSHELRTPLNGVVGLLDLMLGTELTPEQRRYGRMAKNSAGLLTSVIGDILDLSRIEAGKLDMNIEEFNLQLAVEEVMEVLAQMAASKNLESACFITPETPTMIRSDPDRLRQIVVNLVNNAVKFTARGSVVLHVSLDSQTEDRAVIRFAVTDTGIGIPHDRLDRLFKAFSQADTSTTRSFGGTGLGLVISKKLAGLLGGTMGVESEPGRGSTFWFTVNVEIVQQEEAGVGNLDPRNLRVLAVDDSEIQCDILRQQITALGLRATTAHDAEGAIRALLDAAHRAAPYQAAILDWDMPRISGAELALSIRSRPRLRNTALLAALPAGTHIEHERLRAMGFSGQVTKPIRQSQLFDAIMEAISSDRPFPSPAPLPADGPPIAPPGLRVLIAEDNEVNQLVTREVLTKCGYVCDVAPDGWQAAEAVRTKAYDVLLMDCQMPHMDGFEATRLIRRREAESPGIKRIPIIALTANAMKGDRERCLDAGMDGYASKPINPAELLQSIARILEENAAFAMAGEQA